MELVNEVFRQMGGSGFQEAFWSNLLAGLLLAFVASIWINRATDFFKKPQLRLVVKQNGYYRDTILLSKRDDGDYEASFRLAIRNDGNQTLQARQGYWQTFILETEGRSPFSVLGEENHQRGLIEDAVYPKSFTDFGHEWKFKIKKDNLKSADVPFFFSTDYGYFPKSVRVEPRTGKVLFAHMGSVGYELPES